MVRKFVQRLVSVLLAMLLLIQSAVVSVLAKESRGDQNRLILFCVFCRCGRSKSHNDQRWRDVRCL